MKPRPPSSLFGTLFAEVQERALFGDSKTFADAVPLRPVSDILEEHAQVGACDDEALRAFVLERFEVPDQGGAAAPVRANIVQHIEATWDLLTRTVSHPADSASIIALPQSFLVPGGRFRELYYWDSFFTMLGLRQSGRDTMIEALLENFGSLVEEFGHVPNGSRTYYLTRSQPPVLHLMTALSRDQRPATRARRLKWLRAEHDFWMKGADRIQAGEAHRRTVRLPDGSLLNRYWDDCQQPRDESWREDVALARRSTRPAAELWRDIRAGAESGWDFSSRWLDAGGDLATIRTTRIVPIDLNCLLYRLEQTIAAEAEALGHPDAGVFSDRAVARAKAIRRHLWDDQAGYYGDYDLDRDATSGLLSGAAAFPLFVGLADGERATRIVRALETLLRPGGLVATAVRSGQQWDAPNGWAPLQWIAITGLRRYGFVDQARTIADRWTSMVADTFEATGLLLEKYDVERRAGGMGGEYANQVGFGWTNGVYLALTGERS